VSRPKRSWLIGLFCFLAACDQLGNPPQFATPPTLWDDAYGSLETTTRSFRDENTIRRLVSEGLGELDHADPSIGPSQTLTLVTVLPRRIERPRGQTVELVTIFKFPDRAPVVRPWSAIPARRRWVAAFATPEPPVGAITSVAP